MRWTILSRLELFHQDFMKFKSQQLTSLCIYSKKQRCSKCEQYPCWLSAHKWLCHWFGLKEYYRSNNNLKNSSLWIPRVLIFVAELLLSSLLLQFIKMLFITVPIAISHSFLYFCISVAIKRFIFIRRRVISKKRRSIFHTWIHLIKNKSSLVTYR